MGKLDLIDNMVDKDKLSKNIKELNKEQLRCFFNSTYKLEHLEKHKNGSGICDQAPTPLRSFVSGVGDEYFSHNKYFRDYIFMLLINRYWKKLSNRCNCSTG